MPVLHSNILGEGEPFLILHGFLGMSDNWKTLGSQYAERGYEVHLVDQRNHGKSFWSEDFDYTLLAEDLKHYMDHHQIAEATILGHSMGGKTAMQFACSYPDRVSALIVADISPKYYPPHHQYIIDALTALPIDEISSRSKADFLLAEHLHDWGIRQFLLKSLHWVEKGRLAFRFNLNVLATKMEEIGDSISGTDSFKGPTLFLRGSRSEYITEQDLPMIKQHFPSASLETVADSGHWLHAENPGEFLKLSLLFLNS
ncbi:MAG: alpha/beta fold hydrolase [Flavobacteriaceae bacterium]|nr:alpha/beta fold hydrolase [Flavobacteriaceae bacterium]